MASPKSSQRARGNVIRYLLSAQIAAELKKLDKEGNFSPHMIHGFLLTMGRIVAIVMETFSLEQYKARHIAQRIMLTYLKDNIAYPPPHFEAWVQNEAMLLPLSVFHFTLTVEGVKATCYHNIRKFNDKINIDDAWDNIKTEIDRITSTWLMKEEPFGVTEEALKAELCLCVSKFYGLIVGNRVERKESVRYFLEREVLDYITEEGLEINYVLDQRKRKKAEKAS